MEDTITITLSRDDAYVLRRAIDACIDFYRVMTVNGAIQGDELSLNRRSLMSIYKAVDNALKEEST